MAVTDSVPNDWRSYTWALTISPREIGWWRRRVASAAASLGASSAALQVIRLGVSELLTNICTHVEDPACQLMVQRAEQDLYVRVFDHSSVVPAIRSAAAHSECGRGLLLVREMAAGLGYVCTPGGKWVWFSVVLGTEGPAPAP